VINTCSVTQAAERKSRQMVRKVARQNPAAIVVMTGCYGEMAKIKGETVEEATLVVPNHQKMDTLRHVLQTYPHLERAIAEDPLSRAGASVCTSHPRHAQGAGRLQRLLLFLLDSYTRKKVMASQSTGGGRRRSGTPCYQGYREIVITGVLVGAYARIFPPRPRIWRISCCVWRRFQASRASASPH